MGILPNFTGIIPGWSPIKVVQTVPVGCISRLRVKKKRFSKCNFQKSSCPKKRPRAFIFGILHHPEVLYQSCLNYAPGVKIDPALGVTILH